MEKELLKLLVESIDFEKLLIGLVEKIAEQALKDLAAKSETPIDDALVAIILPALNPALELVVKTQVEKLKVAMLK